MYCHYAITPIHNPWMHVKLNYSESRPLMHIAGLARRSVMEQWPMIRESLQFACVAADPL